MSIDGTVYFTSEGNSTKYATAYKNGTTTYRGEMIKEVCRTGDASKEIWIVSSEHTWFYDASGFVDVGSPFASRSGECGNVGHGLFRSMNSKSYTELDSFRMVIVRN